MRILALLAAVMLLSACGSTPQAPVNLSSNYFEANKDNKLGVYLNAIPEVDTSLPGASCLLCYAAASAANSSLSSHFQSLQSDDLAVIDEELLELLKAKGVKAQQIDTNINIDKLKKFKTKELNFASKDFRSLKDTLAVDQLLVIDFDMVGAVRSYSSYIPNGPPTAAVSGTVYIVDLASNQYVQFDRFNINLAAQGEWDEPPAFPGLTTSYYQVVEMAKDRIKKQFDR